MPEPGIGYNPTVIVRIAKGVERQTNARCVVGKGGRGREDDIVPATQAFGADGEKRKNVAIRTKGDEMYSHPAIHI